jgi:hypothetical protein
VADQHQGQAALPPEGVEQADDLVPGVLVQVPGRLVGQQDLGLLDQGAGDGHPLLLAAGQFARQVLRPVAEPDAVQGGSDPFVPLRVVHGERDQRGLDVLVRAERGDQVEGLEDEAERVRPHLPDLRFGCGGQIPPGEGHPAPGRPVQPAEELEQRGLAVAGLALDGEPLALADFEVKVADGEDLAAALAVGLADPGQLVDVGARIHDSLAFLFCFCFCLCSGDLGQRRGRP